MNHVDYYPAADKPYILTTSDDRTIKIWDYTTKAQIAVLEGHTSNVSFACFHPELPIIISGSEDGTVKVWHANTYRLEQTLSYGLERAWCVSYQRGKNALAIGFDEGCVVVKMGREEPAMSMDASGKIVWARHNEVLSAAIKPSGMFTSHCCGQKSNRLTDADIQDGEPLSLPTKDLGSCEIYPQSLLHSPNGRFVSVCGDGEYIIYTALAWRNKAFGQALDFVWAGKDNGNDYAIRESSTSVRLFKNFKEKSGGLDFGFSAQGLFGGVLLAVKGADDVAFFDWETGSLVRKIEAAPINVYWSDSGELVVLATEDSFYVLRFSREAYLEALQDGSVDPDEGVEAAFELVTEVNEVVRTGEWIGDCFVYTNATNRLNYLVGEQTYTISHFDTPMYILGYIPRDSRIYLSDKDVKVVSYALSLSVIEYQTVVLRGDMDAAAELLDTIPQDQKNKVARFLEGQGYQEMALEVATDPEHRFELALALHNLEIALEIAREADSEHKWKQVGDAALAGWNIVLAQECFEQAKDIGSLLLLNSATSDVSGLQKLADLAESLDQHNVAFSCYWQIGDTKKCIEILLKTDRKPEAALFAQTYKPSLAKQVVGQWKESLVKQKKEKIAEAVAVPEDDAELFPNWGEYLKLEDSGEVDLIDIGASEDNGMEEE